MTGNGRLAAVVLGALCSCAAAADVRFIAAPEAVRSGDAVKIRFEVSGPTDVQVCVVDAGGRIVRRLAAGLLGPNAPAPLAKDSLKQELTWDGRDDNGAAVAPEAGCKVRVSLGLRAEPAGPGADRAAVPGRPPRRAWSCPTWRSSRPAGRGATPGGRLAPTPRGLSARPGGARGGSGPRGVRC